MIRVIQASCIMILFLLSSMTTVETKMLKPDIDADSCLQAEEGHYINYPIAKLDKNTVDIKFKSSGPEIVIMLLNSVESAKFQYRIELAVDSNKKSYVYRTNEIKPICSFDQSIDPDSDSTYSLILNPTKKTIALKLGSSIAWACADTAWNADEVTYLGFVRPSSKLEICELSSVVTSSFIGMVSSFNKR
jgi:hypothetical protein